MLERRLLALAADVRGRLVGVVALGLAVTACYVGQALLVAEVLRRILEGRPWSSAIGPIAVVVVLQGAKALLLWFREVVAMATAGELKLALRHRLYHRLLELGPGALGGSRTGATQSTLVDGVEALERYFGRFLPLLISSVVGAVLIVAYLWSIDPVVGAIVFGCGLLVPLAPRASGSLLQPRMTQWYNQYKSLYADSLDAIQGMSTLKAFNAHRRWGEELDAQAVRFAKASTGLVSAGGVAEGIVGLAASAGMSLAVGVGALRLADGALELSELLIILLLARECFRPLTELQKALHSAYPAVAAAEGIFALLDAEVIVPEPAAMAPGAPRPALAPSITFDDVTFAYRAGGAPALRALSLEVAPGETVALVGRSGAGKTTVVSLVLRFFDPDRGRVLLGGNDLRELPLEVVRGSIAVVSQDTYLFHGTVRRNLLLGRPDATVAEVEAAARDAAAHDFIAALPQGYDTVIGERGLKLSGGERQRIAIARALLKDAPILVLDEATSSIDAAGEAAIQGALDRLTATRTTLVVAHRLSTVRDADRIVVLEAGTAVEIGDPSSLLAGDGHYARFVAAQSGVR